MKNFQNVLITGGCGFIGSNYINNIVPLFPTVNFYNIDCLNYSGSVDNVKVKTSNYTFIMGNLCNTDLVKNIMEKYKIDCIIHFAAQTHVDNSFNFPMDFIKDNILATHTLLELCKTNPVKLFIYCSTDEVYGDSNNGEEKCKIESSMLEPTNPYAATKASCEMLCYSYSYSFKIPIIITRCNNVYGPNQYKEKLIPKFINHINLGESCTIHGKGDQLRTFIHVDDFCNALNLIIEKGNIGEIYNIGSEDEFSVMDIFEKLGGNKFHHVEDRAFNDSRYCISIYKLKKLGYIQKVNFDEGLRNLKNSKNF